MRCNDITRWGIFTLLVCLSVYAAAPEPKPGTWKGLEHMMSMEEFHAAGLDQLSREELSRLNQWLVRFLAHESQQVVKSDEKIQELKKLPVRRRIVGPFRGWDGNTTFTLDNGEIWKQRLPGSYAVKLENPEVEILRNLLGFYELKVIKTGRKIGVTRIQ